MRTFTSVLILLSGLSALGEKAAAPNLIYRGSGDSCVQVTSLSSRAQISCDGQSFLMGDIRPGVGDAILTCAPQPTCPDPLVPFVDCNGNTQCAPSAGPSASNGFLRCEKLGCYVPSGAKCPTRVTEGNTLITVWKPLAFTQLDSCVDVCKKEFKCLTPKPVEPYEFGSPSDKPEF